MSIERKLRKAWFAFNRALVWLPNDIIAWMFGVRPRRRR